MTDTTNDIDALLRLWSESARSDHRRYHRALTSLIAERDELKQRVEELKRDVDMWREDAHKWKEMYNRHYESERVWISRCDELKQRVAVLESQEFTLPTDPFRDPDRDLRERLVCAALTGVMAHPSTVGNPKDLAEIAVAHADAAIAAMRKGDSDGK